MALTHSQKKFLKRHASGMTIAQLSRQLDTGEAEISSYLKKLWGEEKFHQRQPVRETSPEHAQIPPAKLRLILSILVVLTVAAYANSVGGEFISDDKRYLVDNPLIHSVRFVTATPATIFKATVNYLTYLLFGLSPWAFHGVNIMFHALAVISVFGILNMFTGWLPALLAASVVAVHPVFTESVSWIGGGGYAMYGSLFLLSFWLYLVSEGRGKRFAASFTVFLLCLLSSEKAIPLLAAYPLYEFCRGTLRRNLKIYLPFVVAGLVWTGIVFGVLRYGAARLETLESDFSISGYYNPLVQIPVAVASYVKLLIFPKDLSFFYSRLQFPLAEYLMYVGVTLGFAGVSVLAFFKNRRIFFFLALAVLALTPSLTPLVLAWVVAERYAYLSFIAMIMALTIATAGIAGKRRIYLPVILAVLALLFTRTVIRNFDWTSEDTIWFATYKTAPQDPRVHNNVGEYYLKRKEYNKAETEFKTAISLTSTRPAPYYNLGLLYHQTGRDGEAVEALKKSVTVSKTFADGYRLLATIYFDRGEYKDALNAVLRLKELEPDNSMVFLNLGMIYEKLGMKSAAEEAYQHAVSLDPGNRVAEAAVKRLHPLSTPSP